MTSDSKTSVVSVEEYFGIFERAKSKTYRVLRSDKKNSNRSYRRVWKTIFEKSGIPNVIVYRVKQTFPFTVKNTCYIVLSRNERNRYKCVRKSFQREINIINRNET